MAIAFKYPHPVTEELVIALSDANPLLLIETTAEGEIIMSPPTRSYANCGETQLAYQVTAWNEQHRLGRVLTLSGGLTLFDGAIKAPDAAWISHDRWNAMSELDRHRAFVRLAPDAVFELLSPKDSLKRLHRKIDEYLRNGVGVATLLNPRDRTVTVYRASNEPEIAKDPTALSIPEMPGFTLDARRIFDLVNEGTDDRF